MSIWWSIDRCVDAVVGRSIFMAVSSTNNNYSSIITSEDHRAYLLMGPFLKLSVICSNDSSVISSLDNTSRYNSPNNNNT